MSNRIQHIDLGAGIMLLWMVCYHVLQKAWWLETATTPEPNGINPCVVFPYLSFFMPGFFYKSGMFFRRKAWKELLIKDTKKLLVTYAVWGGIGYLIYVVMCIVAGDASIHTLIYRVIRRIFLSGVPAINGPCWFLLALFIVHVLANLLLPAKNEDSKREWLFHARCLAVIVLGYALSFVCNSLNLRLMPSWVAYCSSGLGFYALGYWLGRYEKYSWLYIPCIIIYGICCLVGFPMVDMASNKVLNGMYLLWMPIAGCSIIAFNTLCWFIITFNASMTQYKSYVIRFFENVGENAMLIMVSHFLILETYVFVIYQTDWFTLPHFLICATMMTILIAAVLLYENQVKSKKIS